MQGLIYDIKRFAIHDGPGIRTTVFFKGCPLDCWWCHNPESRKQCIEKTKKTNKLDDKEYIEEDITGYKISPEALIDELKKDIDFMEESGGGVTFSGGEPLMQPDFLESLLILCRKEKIHTAIDTSGYADNNIFKKIAGKADLFLFDLKHPDEEKHLKYTAVSAEMIFSNLKYLHEMKIPVIIRIPIIPGINDGKDIHDFIHLLKSKYPAFKEIHLLPYHNIASHKYERFGLEDRMKESKKSSDREMVEIAKLFQKSGFETIVGG